MGGWSGSRRGLRNAGVRALLAVVACAASLGLGVGPVFAGDEEELESARAAVEAGLYQDAASRLVRMLDGGGATCVAGAPATKTGCTLTDAAVRLRARGYFAIALVALERDAEASQQLELMLRESPTFSPSPAIYPRRVIELYLEVRRRLEAELTSAAVGEQQRLAAEAKWRRDEDVWAEEVAKLAAQSSVTSTRSRWIAALPLGIGQLQNGNVGLGAMFMATEASLGIATIVTAVLHDDLASRAQTSEVRVDPSALSKQLEQLRVANWIAFGALGVFALAGVVEAQIMFEPSDVTSAPRPVPPRPKRPEVSIVPVPNAPEALGAGVQVRF
jgi:hypothetical protein